MLELLRDSCYFLYPLSYPQFRHNLWHSWAFTIIMLRYFVRERILRHFDNISSVLHCLVTGGYLDCMSEQIKRPFYKDALESFTSMCMGRRKKKYEKFCCEKYGSWARWVKDKIPKSWTNTRRTELWRLEVIKLPK